MSTKKNSKNIQKPMGKNCLLISHKGDNKCIDCGILVKSCNPRCIKCHLRKLRKLEFDSNAKIISRFDNFNPDKELLKFAERFSKSYKIFSPGIYCSHKDKYKIVYKKRIVNNFGKKINTVFRIACRSKEMEFDKTLLKNKCFTSDFVMYAVLWLVFVHKLKGDYVAADKQCLSYWLKRSKIKKNILIGWLHIFKLNPSREFQTRIKNSIKLLNGKRV